MAPIEIVRGKPESATRTMKQAVRFARRLDRRRIRHHAVFPLLLDTEAVVCKVAIGQRCINIFDDGSFTRSLLRNDGHCDGRAFIAQSNRMHAVYLAMAAADRKCGFLTYARANLNIAIEERRHHERTHAI